MANDTRPMTIDEAKSGQPGRSEAAADPEIRQLSPAIGIEVLGADLTQSLGELAFLRIRKAWEENCVVLFRGQKLSVIKQLRFASRFGVPARTGVGPPVVLEVTNARDVNGTLGYLRLRNGPLEFHSDQCYLDEPPIATMLYAIDVPSHGGNTLFGNGFRAYQSLPEEMKRRLSGRRALHIFDYEADSARRPERLPSNAKSAAHPIFCVHRPTGRQALYVNRLMTWSILDMDPVESRRILDFLFSHQERAEFVYEHVWRPGDLVVWDNRSCIHARTDFDPDERRRMRRITVLDRP
jgi:taurine dioxygenase